MELQKKIDSTFESRFGGHGAVYASAGRINLIGEHTDYNGGFVFPGAIDKVIMAEIRPNDTDTVRVSSIDIDEYTEFGLNEADAPQTVVGPLHIRRMPRNTQTRRQRAWLRRRICRQCTSGSRPELIGRTRVVLRFRNQRPLQQQPD